VERSRSYDVEDLATDLENALTAQIVVKSQKFSGKLQKQIVRQMLPAADEAELNEIDKEIDDALANALDYSQIPIYDGGAENPPGSPNFVEEE
jgi:hypothetical protein